MQNKDIYDLDRQCINDRQMCAPSPCCSQSSISSGYSSNSNVSLTTSPLYDTNFNQGDIIMGSMTAVPVQNLNYTHFDNMEYRNTIGGGGYTSQLVILEQPTEKFRFRYKSEMHGTHGSLNGERSEKNKKTFPEVELRGFSGNGIIRCSLYQTTEDRPSPHSHQLVVRKDDIDECDPHDLNVSPEKGYIARFENMGIIHTAKKNICDALYAKKKQKMKFETGCKELSLKQEKALKEEAEREGKLMNLNQVRLCFEAFEVINGGEWVRICEPVYSRPINNRKSALTGELKICRLSSVVGSVAGGDDLILLVEKVSKKNIQVRFYEMRDEELEWEALGDFSDADVHHQYAIVVRTPAYQNKDIDSNVNIFIELVRKSDDERSAPVSFRYKPLDIVMTRKRRRTTSYTSYSTSPVNSSELPESVPKGIINSEMSETQHQAETISQEFKKYSFLDEYLATVENNSSELIKHVNFNYSNYLETDGSAQINIPQKQYQRSAPIVKSDAAHHAVIAAIKQIKIILCGSQGDMNEKHEQIKKMLEDKFADNENGDTLIHEIIKQGQHRSGVQLFDVLCKTELTDMLSLTNNVGQTPLHYACIFSQHMFIRPLLGKNCKPNAQDNKGNTALHLVVELNCAECLSYFALSIDKNVRIDANLSNDDGFTPLHLAIRQNNVYFVRILLTKFNASAKTAISRDGNNALHLAVQHHNGDIVKLILDNSKVQVNAKNRSGHTSIDLAKTLDEKFRKDILDLLMAKLPVSADGDSPMTIDSIKDEPEDDSSTEEEEDDKPLSPVEDRNEETHIKRSLENPEVLNKLANILTIDDKWKKLGVELELKHLLCLWINARAMLNYIALKVNPLRLLKALQVVDAQAANVLMK